MLKGWECQGCRAFFKAVKRAYYDAPPQCPDKCSLCNEALFKRVEEPELHGMYDKKPQTDDEAEDRYDYIKGMSDTFDTMGRR